MKKLLIPLLAITLMLASCASAVRSIPIYPENTATATFPVTNEGEIAAKISTSVPFCGFEIKTADASTGGSLILSIYSYNASYAASVSAEPIAKEEFDNVKGGDRIYLQTREIPAGEYLLITEIKGDGLTFEKTAGKSDNVAFYYAQNEITDGAFPIRLIYNAEKAGTMTAAEILSKPAPQPVAEE